MIRDHAVTDLHVHIQPWHELAPAARERLVGTRDSEEAKRIAAFLEDPAAFVRQLDAWGVDRAALVNYVAPDTMGFTERTNDWVLRYCAEHRDRLLPVGSVHPRLQRSAGDAYRAVEALAAREVAFLKLHPAHQLVWPDAYRADSRGAHGHPPDDRPYGDALEGLYEACVDHALPLMVHTGTSLFEGAVNVMAEPMTLDTVAVDFPRMTIVLAHAGRPLWGDAAAYVARRHANVWLDLSSIPPTRLLRYVPDLPRLADKCLWGTDWPGPGLPQDAPRRNVEAFLAAELGLDDAAKRMVLDGNSRKVVR